MKFVYTEIAKKELDNFYTMQKENLENIISNNKYVFGDNEVEVTASDIKEAERYIRFVDIHSNKKRMMRRLITGIYFFIGVLALIFGLFYNQIKDILNDNPIQLALILSGVIFILFSVLLALNQRGNNKDRQYISIQKEINEKVNTL